MATRKLEVQTASDITPAGYTTLASATYVATSGQNAGTNDPVDVLVTVTAASTNVIASLKQLAVFVQVSIDGTNYTTGPTSGTTTTDEPDLIPLGVVPMNVASTDHRMTFSMRREIGYIPTHYKIVAKNEIGVAMTSGSIKVSEVFETIA